jgi:flagellar motor switch protein FliM
MSDQDILSQDEINTLVDAVQSGRVRSAAARSQPLPEDVKPLDLAGRSKIIRGRMPMLDILSERLSGLIRTGLFNLLRRPVNVEFRGVQVVRFETWASDLPEVSCLNLVRLAPLRGQSLVHVDVGLLFGLMEQLFGGGMEQTEFKPSERGFTSIEQNMIAKVVDLVLDGLDRTWAPVYRVRPKFIRTETKVQNAAIAGETDTVLVIKFQVNADPIEGELAIVMPENSIQPVRMLLTSDQADREDEPETFGGKMIPTISSVSADVRVLLGRGQISIRDLMALEVGDTIQLDTDSTGVIPCLIQGVTKAWGRPVTNRGRLSLELVSRIGEPPPQNLVVSKKIGEPNVGLRNTPNPTTPLSTSGSQSAHESGEPESGG